MCVGNLVVDEVEGIRVEDNKQPPRCETPLLPPRHLAKVRSEAVLPTIQVGPQRAGKPQAAGWLSSLALHSLLLFAVWFLFAPADLGGVNAIMITMSWVEEDPPESPTVSISSGPVVTEPEIAQPAPAAVALPKVSKMMPVTGGGGSGDAPDAQGTGGGVGASGASGGPRGTFFGVEAYGHEFVYIVDMSGSMQGHLYNRAIAELMRSIAQLGSKQKFYVTLFSDRASPMFDDEGFQPEPVESTPENRERLAAWLQRAYDGGGTDPRDAVKLALDMNPSAIFMLSDGAFNVSQQFSRRTSGLGLLAKDDSTTASLVRHSENDVPIHTIAFENPQSRKNMKELAELTSGSFKYVEPQQTNANIAEVVALAKRTDAAGEPRTAQIYLDEAIESLSIATLDFDSQEQLTGYLVAKSDDCFHAKDLQGAVATLKLMVLIDPNGAVVYRQQKSVLDRCKTLITQSLQSQTLPKHGNELGPLVDLAGAFRNSRIGGEILANLGSDILERADQFAQNQQVEQALVLYQRLNRMPLQPAVAKRTRTQLDRLIADQIALAQRLGRDEGVLAMVTHLEEKLGQSGPHWLNAGGRKVLEDASMNLHAQLRDAAQTHDQVRQAECREIIDACVAKSPAFASVGKDLVRYDRLATSCYRRAFRSEQKGDRVSAVRSYQTLLTEFPYAKIAKVTRERLASLTGEVAVVDSNKLADIDITDIDSAASTFLDQFNELVEREVEREYEDGREASQSVDEKPVPAEGWDWFSGLAP